MADLSFDTLEYAADCMKAYIDYYYNDVMNNSNLPDEHSMSLITWEESKPKVKRITLEEYMSK